MSSVQRQLWSNTGKLRGTTGEGKENPRGIIYLIIDQFNLKIIFWTKTVRYGWKITGLMKELSFVANVESIKSKCQHI